MIYDISMPLGPGFPAWAGDPPVDIRQVTRIEDGDPYTVTRLNISAHTATHVDAPKHFVAGRAGVDDLPLDVLTGPAWVAAFDTAGDITAADLEAARIPAGTQRLLLKTPNSRLWDALPAPFDTGFIGVAEDGAHWLVARGIRLVGIDYLSIEAFAAAEAGAPVHHILLGADVIVLEGLDLRSVPPGDYQLYCLPVNLAGADGAPARAILVRPG